MGAVIAIVGPTAAGKSRLALQLARRLDGEIVNADALQVYRGLDVGTAKPSGADRRLVRHHLLDIKEPSEGFSAGEFARRARAAIDEIGARGRTALVVGGSGLYLRALLDGISPLPPGDLEVRRRLVARLEREGLEALRAELARLDPTTERRLAPGDRQRVLRALEVAIGSGRPLSDWIAERPFGERRLEALRIGLTLPRAILYDRIALRTGRMAEAGWVEEVAALLDAGVEDSAPAFQAIGYRQIVRYLRGGCSLDAALGQTVRETRRYAKRQLTWFRRDAEIVWLRATDPDRAAARALEVVTGSSTRGVHA